MTDNLKQLVKQLLNVHNEEKEKQKIIEIEILLNLKRTFFNTMLELINNIFPFFTHYDPRTRHIPSASNNHLQALNGADTQKKFCNNNSSSSIFSIQSYIN